MLRLTFFLLGTLLVISAPALRAQEMHSHAHHDQPQENTSKSTKEKQYHPSQQADMRVSVEPVDEVNSLVASVSRNGKPVSGVTVSFEVPRLFGILVLGEAATQEEGKAIIPFPEDFSGDAKTGNIPLTARIVRSDVYFGELKADLPGGKPFKVVENPFPREIWSPKTDWILLLTIPVLLSTVWSIYLFSIRQLFRIRRLGQSP